MCVCASLTGEDWTCRCVSVRLTKEDWTCRCVSVCLTGEDWTCRCVCEVCVLTGPAMLVVANCLFHILLLCPWSL